MRVLKFAIACFILLTAIQSCKPKNDSKMEDLFNKSSDSVATRQPVQNDLSPQELLTRKWKVTATIPEVTGEDAEEIRNSTLEFTKQGKLFYTAKGKTEEVASVNFSFDNKYLLSKEPGRDEVDTLLVQELSVNRLVLVMLKENRTLIAEPVK